jgi:hypothetical protein
MERFTSEGLRTAAAEAGRKRAFVAKAIAEGKITTGGGFTSEAFRIAGAAARDKRAFVSKAILEGRITSSLSLS